MRGSAMVITTIRADRLEQLQGVLAQSAVEVATFPLGPIETAYYGQLVDGPAQRRTMAGKPLTVFPDLRDALIGDIKGQGDILPLLAFTMHRLYVEYGSDGKLELHEYEAMGKIASPSTAELKLPIAAVFDVQRCIVNASSGRMSPWPLMSPISASRRSGNTVAACRPWSAAARAIYELSVICGFDWSERECGDLHRTLSQDPLQLL